MELGLGRGKRQFEKRQAIAEREHRREMEREVGAAALAGSTPPVYWRDNRIWGCTGFDLSGTVQGKRAEVPGCLVKSRDKHKRR